jgi:hypothetical protein
MKLVTKFLMAGGVAAAALMTAAPAAAQYYPGYGYPGYGYGGGGIGQVLNQVLGGGYGYNNYGANSQVAVNQCMGAVQSRLGGYGSPYGGYNGTYGYANGRVLGVSRVEPRSNGGVTVRGVATSGRFGNGQPDLTFKCKVDYRGYVSDVDIDPAQGAYGYNGYNGYNNGYGYAPYNNGYDYSQYGYRRY